MVADGGGRGLSIQFLCWSGWSANGSAYRRGTSEEPGRVYWFAAQRCEVRHSLQALGNPQPRAELIVQSQSISVMERRDHSGTVTAGTIPQRRERVSDESTFVNRPQFAEGFRFEHRRAGWEVRNGLGTIVLIFGHHIEGIQRQGNSRLIAGLLI